MIPKEIINHDPEKLAKKKAEQGPRQFLDTFRQSDFYKEAYNNFFAGKNMSPEVTNQEKKEAFERSSLAQTAFIEFARGTFHYNSGSYSPNANKAIENYVNYVKSMKSAQGNKKEADDIINLDAKRSSYHLAVAKELLQDGTLPNIRIAKVIGRLILIDNDLDTYESALDMK